MLLSYVLGITCLPQAECAHPGLTQDFISGVLDAEGVSLNLPETLLRLACFDVSQYTVSSPEDEFIQLNYRARGMCVVVTLICTIKTKH
jgi:hypothetical protein